MDQYEETIPNLEPPPFNLKATGWLLNSFYLDDIISYHKDHPY